MLVARFAALAVVVLVALTVLLSGCANDDRETLYPGGYIVGLWYAQRCTGQSDTVGVAGPILALSDALLVFDPGLFAVTFRLDDKGETHYEETLNGQIIFWWDANYQVAARQPVDTGDPDVTEEQGVLVFQKSGKAGGSEFTWGDQVGSGTLGYHYLRLKRNSQWVEFLDLTFEERQVIPLKRSQDPRCTDQTLTLTHTRLPFVSAPLPPPGLH